MERLPMSDAKEILRMRWALRLSVREVSRATSASTGVVSKTVKRAELAGLTWEAVDALEEAELELRLYGVPKSARASRAEPDPSFIHRELRRAGVTLELLHLEYLEEHPGGLRYTAFCDRYRAWHARTGVVMRQVHRAGEKVFVDYSGKRPRFTDPRTGQSVDVELFVAVLGASNYTFVEATLTQRITDFIGAHTRAFAYFAGVPKMTVPDQLRSAVSAPCRYEPTINRTYAELGRHDGTAIVPARPRKPRDKAKVEVGVQVAQRWILARIRNETFFSLEALNRRIAELLKEMNARPMKRLGDVSRRDLFERYDRSALSALPSEPYVISEWRGAKVAPDYHITLLNHHYSVPYSLCRRGRGGSLDRHDGRGLSSRRAGRVARAELRGIPTHDARRSHAGGAPRGVRGGRCNHRVGARRRADVRGVGATDPGVELPSRDRLAICEGLAARDGHVRPGASRAGVRARSDARRAQLQAGRATPEARPRVASAAC